MKICAEVDDSSMKMAMLVAMAKKLNQARQRARSEVSPDRYFAHIEHFRKKIQGVIAAKPGTGPIDATVIARQTDPDCQNPAAIDWLMIASLYEIEAVIEPLRYIGLRK